MTFDDDDSSERSSQIQQLFGSRFYRVKNDMQFHFITNFNNALILCCLNITQFFNALKRLYTNFKDGIVSFR